MKYINLDPKTMKNHGILVHLRHILINFLDFDLTICFWQYVLDSLPPQLLSKKHFFSIFWHGVTSPPPIWTMSTNILFFFLRLPLREYVGLMWVFAVFNLYGHVVCLSIIHTFIYFYLCLSSLIIYQHLASYLWMYENA